MAGDVPITEQLVIGDPGSMSVLSAAIERSPKRILHRYGERVLVVESLDEERGAFAVAQVLAVAEELPDSALAGLTEVERFGVKALQLRQSSEYAAIKGERPRQGEPWDMHACTEVAAAIHGPMSAGAPFHAPAPPTSAFLEGSVAVGIIIVEGPTAALQFTQAERTTVVAEVQNGLSFYAARNPTAGLTFTYAIVDVSLDVPSDPNAADLEALWRDPTMASLGHSGSWAGVGEYVEAIRAQFGTRWTYCAYFTKYPLGWFAYASIGGPRLVMDYNNDGWGPANIDRVFAHETGHIFACPDEYASSGCNCGGAWGRWGEPNGNCQNCAPAGGGMCLMKGNDWSLCPWTPFHLGWQYNPVYAEGDPGRGIGGYDLKSAADRAFAFDYQHSGKADHLALYRPGTGTMWILKNTNGTFSPVYAEGDPGNGIGGYDLASPADRAFAFDYDSSGKLDHIVLYRPGTGTMWILKNTNGTFSPVYAEGAPGNGIGGYDLASPADRAFAFDYDSSGKLDHLALFRPGSGTIWILENASGAFKAVYAEGAPGNGIGGYDLASPADRAFALVDGGSKLVLYRPGSGTMWVQQNSSGTFAPIYSEGDPGNGIGGYDLASPADRAFAFDYDSSGKLDHIVLCRPGTGTIWILQKP